MDVFRMIKAWLSSGPFCIRIRRNQVSITDVATGRKWEDEPLIALSKKGNNKIISAIGAVARETGDELINPFDHPRVLVADFVLGEKLLQHGFQMVCYGFFIVPGIKWTPSPIVVIHILEELEGGLSPIEAKALREMAHGAGAREVHIWNSSELSDAEIKNGFYKSRHRNRS
jgi:rod shape-determining protein MreB and related proteins